MRVAGSVLDFVGRTPMVRLSRVSPASGAVVFGGWESASLRGPSRPDPAFGRLRRPEGPRAGARDDVAESHYVRGRATGETTLERA